jgi:AcrR family transcriptional regulator
MTSAVRTRKATQTPTRRNGRESPGDKAGTSTRTRLLLTAMHLFARNGLDGVTLRRISSESGSANTAVVHYHFKDRAGPIDAIIIFLDENVWMPAFLRLKEGIDAGVSLRELIDLGLWPGKQTVFDHPWGADAQACMFRFETGNDEVARRQFSNMRKKHDLLSKRGLRRALPELTPTVFEQHWQFLYTEASTGQWVRAYLLGEPAEGKWTPRREERYLSCHLDYVVGGLQAPVWQ